MIKSCSCGGRYRRTDIVAEYSEKYKRVLYGDTDPIQANWACEKCGAKRTQRKRLPHPDKIYATFTNRDKIWPLCSCGHSAQHHPHTLSDGCLCDAYSPLQPLTPNQILLEASRKQHNKDKSNAS